VTGDRDMYAAVTPAERREPAGLPCATAVYVEDGDGMYRTYQLIGGP